MRRAARIDKNQKEIADAFKQLGCSVCFLHAVGKGVPDLLIGKHGINMLVEVKAEKGKFTPDQKEWHENWRGLATVARNLNDCQFIVDKLWEMSK